MGTSEMVACLESVRRDAMTTDDTIGHQALRSRLIRENGAGWYDLTAKGERVLAEGGREQGEGASPTRATVGGTDE